MLLVSYEHRSEYYHNLRYIHPILYRVNNWKLHRYRYGHER